MLPDSELTKVLSLGPNSNTRGYLANLERVGSSGSNIEALGGLIVDGGITNNAVGAINRVGVNVNFTAAATTIVSGALAQPANTRITGLTALVTTALAQPSGNVGISVGTAAAGVQISAADADSLVAGNTAVAAFTEAILVAAGTTPALSKIVPASDAIKRTTADREVHFTVTSSAGAFTAGAITFIVEYENMLPLA